MSKPIIQTIERFDGDFYRAFGKLEKAMYEKPELRSDEEVALEKSNKNEKEENEHVF